jgi:hypothetical protein
MSLTVCLGANTIYYPEGGGHLWVCLNWALGLRELGCQVIWLEQVGPDRPLEETQRYVSLLKSRLMPYGLAERVALCAGAQEAPLPPETTAGCLDLEVATQADLLLNFNYELAPSVIRRFRRSALVDIDPGLLQIWASREQLRLERHDAYFTIGETVGRRDARFPDLGLQWHYTPPCVSLTWWPPRHTPVDAPFTTVVHWFASSWTTDTTEPDDKRAGFLPYLDLPRRTDQPLELAINLGPDDDDWVATEQGTLSRHGWRMRDAHAVAGTPWDYQSYIQGSRGEFSCAKPSCLRLENAWISDRTLCYLASGKPAVVQYTGPSRILPDAAGLFRFRTPEEAARGLETVAADYERQCRLARALAEEYFDAAVVAGRVLERAIR